MSQNNRIERVAIVGASGHIGKHFTEELLKTGKHAVTTITRSDSKAEVPEGVKVARVDYDDDGSSLISALQGQQFLVITLSVMTPPETHSKIVQAAVKAGVPYIMPNTYGYDILNESLQNDDTHSATSLRHCKEIQKLGGSYISMVCGFWYEWSLALGEKWFGFDMNEKKAYFNDDGSTKINTSTMRLCGRALASLLSLPETGASPCIAD